MSTKSSIKYRLRDDLTPGFHLYNDVADSFGWGDNFVKLEDTPVYLEMEGVDVEAATLKRGKAVVTVILPREMARALGLLEPLPAASGNVPGAE